MTTTLRLRNLLLACGLLLAVAGTACAQTAPRHWVEGKNYFAIPNAPATRPSGKIVVTEVFSFGCPFCNELEPYIDKLRARLPKDAVLEFLPASWDKTDEDWPVFQRTYFAAKALHLTSPKSRDAVFDAVWTPGGPLNTYDLMIHLPKPASQLPTIQDVAKFYTRFGGHAAQFVKTANSPAVNAAMQRADQQIVAWGVTGTPTLVVDGKWRASVPSANGEQELVDLTLHLVDQELAAKKKAN